MPIVVKHDNGLERKIIGTLDPDKKEFSKKVTTSKHLFRKLNAWGIDAQYLHDVLAPQDYTIKIVDTEEHVRYFTTAKFMLEKGTFYHFKTAFVDYGAQVFLPRPLWDSVPFTPQLGRGKKAPEKQELPGWSEPKAEGLDL